VSIEEFLRQQAFNIAVNGTYTLDYWYDPHGKPRTFACRTTRISPSRMMIAVPVVGKVGDRITPHFRDFGKLDGLISDTTDGGFLLELDMIKPMREEFASKLSWLVAKQKNPNLGAKRKQPRFIPACPHSTLTFADGTIRGCLVIDMSVSGIAVSADVQPPIGTPLAVGACIGRVARLLPDGFAVKFVETQNRDNLDQLIARAPQTRAGAPRGAQVAPHLEDAGVVHIVA
jgi:PilZ domain